MQDSLKHGHIHVNVRRDVSQKQVAAALRDAVGPIDFFVEVDHYGLCTVEYYSQEEERVVSIRKALDHLRRAIYEQSINTRGIIGAKSILLALAENWPEPVYVIPGGNPHEIIVGSDDQSGVAYVTSEFSCQCGL